MRAVGSVAAVVAAAADPSHPRPVEGAEAAGRGPPGGGGGGGGWSVMLRPPVNGGSNVVLAEHGFGGCATARQTPPPCPRATPCTAWPRSLRAHARIGAGDGHVTTGSLRGRGARCSTARPSRGARRGASTCSSPSEGSVLHVHLGLIGKFRDRGRVPRPHPPTPSGCGLANDGATWDLTGPSRVR